MSLQVFLIFFFFVATFACVGMHLFSDDYHHIGCAADQRKELERNSSACGPDTHNSNPYTG